VPQGPADAMMYGMLAGFCRSGWLFGWSGIGEVWPGYRYETCPEQYLCACQAGWTMVNLGGLSGAYFVCIKN